MLKTQQKRQRRHTRIRSKMHGTANVPRLCVFKSSKHIYAQLIDDDKAKTLLQVKDYEIKIKVKTKVDLAKKTGELIAKKAQEKKITQVVFDRAGYKYHGRVKAIADGAREAGLKF